MNKAIEKAVKNIFKKKASIYSKASPGGIVGSMAAMQGRRILRQKNKICPVCKVIYLGQKECCSAKCHADYQVIKKQIQRTHECNWCHGHGDDLDGNPCGWCIGEESA